MGKANPVGNNQLTHGGATRALQLLLDEESISAHGVAVQLRREGHTSSVSSRWSSEYQEVLQITLLVEGQRLFTSRGDSTWVLQQHNDPAHMVADGVVKKWNASHAFSISVLNNWPPNSPHLNPIENVWSYVQATGMRHIRGLQQGSVQGVAWCAQDQAHKVI